MKRYPALLALAAALSTASAAAITIIDFKGVPVGAGETLILDENGQIANDITRTGVTIRNDSGEAGFVDVQVVDGSPIQDGDEVPGGFVLLDGTLRVSSTIPAGEQLVRIRMGYQREALRRAGLRASSVRLLRRRALGRQGARWLPAVQAATGRAGIRWARRSPGRVPGRAGVGDFGFDAENEFVWAFLDRNSDYAVGARSAAEPASLMLLAGGLGALLLSRRYRRHS